MVLGAFTLTLYVSHRAGLPEKPDGSPDELPAAALGWRLLFHVLRATALLGTIGVVLLVGWRATRGEFPIRFGQVEYAMRGAMGGAERVTAAQERRIRILEGLLGLRHPAETEPDQPGG